VRGERIAGAAEGARILGPPASLPQRRRDGKRRCAGANARGADGLCAIEPESAVKRSARVLRCDVEERPRRRLPPQVRQIADRRRCLDARFVRQAPCAPRCTTAMPASFLKGILGTPAAGTSAAAPLLDFLKTSG